MSDTRDYEAEAREQVKSELTVPYSIISFTGGAAEELFEQFVADRAALLRLQADRDELARKLRETKDLPEFQQTESWRKVFELCKTFGMDAATDENISGIELVLRFLTSLRKKGELYDKMTGESLTSPPQSPAQLMQGKKE